MYPNLEAEIARLKVKKNKLAAMIGVTPTTLSLKLNGKYSLSLNECIAIKSALGINKTIEYLFAVSGDGKKAKGGGKVD